MPTTATSLWPNFSGLAAPRGMQEMLREAAGDIDIQTGGKLEFYVDVVGVGGSGAVRDIRHNCYLRVPRNNYMHLLFRVTTPVASPFPAHAVTPDGDDYPGLQDETQLREAIERILQRERTKEVVLFLLNSVA